MTLAAVATLPLLGMVQPVPGFPDHRDYVLVTADGEGLLFWLQSLDVDGPRFLTIAPGRFFPDYAPVLPPAVRAELGLAAGEEPALFCLVTVPPEGPAAATVNLRAPLVVNPSNWRATQVVLADAMHPIRRPMRR